MKDGFIIASVFIKKNCKHIKILLIIYVLLILTAKQKQESWDF